jgi:hypothetical protein
MDGQKPTPRQKITMGHMGMDVLNTTSGFRMTRSIVAILDITIWLQHYFLFLTTIFESLTSSNMS